MEPWNQDQDNVNDEENVEELLYSSVEDILEQFAAVMLESATEVLSKKKNKKILLDQ